MNGRMHTIPGDHVINGHTVRDLAMSAATRLMVVVAGERPAEPLDVSAEMDGYRVTVKVERVQS